MKYFIFILLGLTIIYVYLCAICILSHKDAHSYKHRIQNSRGKFVFDDYAYRNDTVGFINSNGVFIPITTMNDLKIKGIDNELKNF